MFQVQTSGYTRWLPLDSVTASMKLQVRAQLWPRMAHHLLLAHQSQVNFICTFNLILAKNWSKITQANIVTMPSDYTLWHRRMGHVHQCIIKHLSKNTEGGPNQISVALTGACEGCKKKKSKRLPFSSSRLRAKWPLDLVHFDLDKMPVLSIGRYKYTATYLDDYSSYGAMFYWNIKIKNLPHSRPTRLGLRYNIMSPCSSDS